jgi:cytochrome c5
MKINIANRTGVENAGCVSTIDRPMPARLWIAALVLPYAALAQDFGEGQKIFDSNCSQCHTFQMARAMLLPKPADTRPAYLKEFLKTHPPMLNDSEKEAVIAALSRPN